jgi:signal transduction histidine kinase
VFAAVAAEAGLLLGAGITTMARYDPGGMVTILGAWSSTGTVKPDTLGAQTMLGGRNVSTLVFRTERPVRIDDYADATGAPADLGRDWGCRAAFGVPITVEGRLWGVMTVGTTSEEVLPADTEARLAGFTELVGTAIANAEAQAALAASRARIVAAADEARRRIERDLHDGAQQHLVSLALRLREMRAAAPPGSDELVQQLDSMAAGLEAVLEELRETAHGIHPAVLADGGLSPALKALARRSAVPVTLRVQVTGRLPNPLEIAVYYVVSEALTNTVKHARASAANVEVVAGEGILRVRVRDDGCGDADFGHGSGLLGLKDRVEAFGGRITLSSPPGKGTTLEVNIPIAGVAQPRLAAKSC